VQIPRYTPYSTVDQSNILVDHGEHAVLADFGLSRLAAGSELTTTITDGAIPWNAPELFKEDDVVRTPASDIYSFGCVCLEVRPLYGWEGEHILSRRRHIQGVLHLMKSETSYP
jgi:serine/threonine protein kinase